MTTALDSTFICDDPDLAEELHQIIKNVRETLHLPAAWIQKMAASDANGSQLPTTDPAAVCFCLYGAFVRQLHLIEVRDKLEPFRYTDLCIKGAKILAHHVPVCFRRDGIPQSAVALVDFNDNPQTTHADVLAMLDASIISMAALVAELRAIPD